MASKPVLHLRLRIIAWTGFVDMRIKKSDKPTHKTYLSREIKSGLWGRYRRGEVVPSDALLVGTDSLVTRIDANIAAGSMDLLRHQFWDLLNFGRFMTPAELKTFSLKLNVPLRALFFADPNAIEESIHTDKFWYRQPSMAGEDLAELRKHASLDGLAACLILIRMAYLAQNEQACMRFYQIGFEIATEYFNSDLFVTNRMKSVQLVIEYDLFTQIRWLKLDPLVYEGLEPNSITPFAKLFRNWRGRFDDLRAELTDTERKNFEELVKEVKDIKAYRMVA